MATACPHCGHHEREPLAFHSDGTVFYRCTRCSRSWWGWLCHRH